MSPYVRAMLFVLMATLVGCHDTPSSPSTMAPDAAQTQLPADAESDGVVKIAVMADGTVYVDSEAVPIDSLGDKLDAIRDMEAIWYHREAPEAGEPHENAMQVIAEIASRKLPVAMYRDREFTQRLDLGAVAP